MSLIAEKEENSLDPFYSLGDHVSKQPSPNERARKLRFDANQMASEADSQVPVQSGSKKFITKSGSQVGDMAPVNKNGNWRFNASVDNPHQAEVQNAKLNALVVERAMKLRAKYESK
jgi:hypothetical protein